MSLKEEEFEFDAFLSHSSNDKQFVRDIAKRLSNDGIKVWFDEWQIKVGDSIVSKIEEGLKNSRVIVLFMSKNAFQSDWSSLESQTFRFRDPLNKSRRFIPVRIDDEPIIDSLGQFLYVDLRRESATEYEKLKNSCGTTLKRSLHNVDRSVVSRIRGGLSACAISFEWKKAVVGTHDGQCELWDATAGGRFLHAFIADPNNPFSSKTRNPIRNIQLSVDGQNVLIRDSDGLVRIWDVQLGHWIQQFRNVEAAIFSSCGAFVVLRDRQSYKLVRTKQNAPQVSVDLLKDSVPIAAVANGDGLTIFVQLAKQVAVCTVRNERHNSAFILEGDGHAQSTTSAAINSSGKILATGSGERTLRIWSITEKRLTRVLEGHTGTVHCVCWRPNCDEIISASEDRSIRIWNAISGRCLARIDVSDSPIIALSCSRHGERLFACDSGGRLFEWEIQTEIDRQAEDELRASATLPLASEVQYTNAKVLLVGNTGVGKTCIANRLALHDYRHTESTLGAWATQWKIDTINLANVEREIWLWDFGGQADQRIIHQLYMDQTHLAILVFDPQAFDVFEGLDMWDRDLMRACKQHYRKILVAGRVDTGRLRATSQAEIREFAKQRNYVRYIETSAKENLGCEELRLAICELIDWNQIAEQTTPALFRMLKDEIIRMKKDGRVLMRFNELRDALTLRLNATAEGIPAISFSDEELKTVILLLTGPGVVWELSFGTWILLQPELINAYAQSVILTLSQDEREIGCISESRVLNGELLHANFIRLRNDEERIILLAMHQILIEKGICIRDEAKDESGTNLLIFPGFARRKRRTLVDHPAVSVSYAFEGFIDDIYSALVVRLNHTKLFERDELWRDAADFRTIAGGRRLGIKLLRRDREGEIQLYFDSSVPVETQMVFSKCVNDHLKARAENVRRTRYWRCKSCDEPVENHKLAMARLEELRKDATIICVKCEVQIPLWDALEESFWLPKVNQMALEIAVRSQESIENKSRIRQVVGEIISTVTNAHQVSRESNAIKGVGIELDLFNADGSGYCKRIYLHIVGDVSSTIKSQKGEQMTFRLPEIAVLKEWRNLDGPVFAIFKVADTIFWADLSYAIVSKGNRKYAEIKSARFDVMAIRNLRESFL